MPITVPVVFGVLMQSCDFFYWNVFNKLIFKEGIRRSELTFYLFFLLQDVLPEFF